MSTDSRARRWEVLEHLHELAKELAGTPGHGSAVAELKVVGIELRKARWRLRLAGIALPGQRD